MNKLNLLNTILAAIILIAGCKKSEQGESIPEYPTPVISSITPSNPLPGASVSIKGKYFGTDASKIQLTTAEQKELSLIIKSVSDTLITAMVPDSGMITTFSKQYTVLVKRLFNSEINERLSEGYPITVVFKEPKGWYYLSDMYASEQINMVTFPTSDTGYVYGTKTLRRSVDGGATWKGDSYEMGSFGNAFYAYDGLNYWLESADDVYSSITGGADGTLTETKEAGNGLISGLYMSSSNSGYIAYVTGNLYIVENLKEKKIELAYTSFYSDKKTYSYMNWKKMSYLDEYNMMITGIASYNGKTIRIICHKHDGIYKEYDLSNMPDGGGGVLQLVDKNTAYSSGTPILKYTGGKTWIKLTQNSSAIHFIDVNTGYAAYDGKIVKTTDGGLTWNDEFVLKNGEEITSITSRNGKLWAVGRKENKAYVLKCNML